MVAFRSTTALWSQGRRAFFQAQPLAAALTRPLQRAVFDDDATYWDADDEGAAAEDAARSLPAFAANRTLTLADPGHRVDGYLRHLVRAHTVLALSLEQPASALWPLARRAAWLPTLNSRHHPPLVRARALLQPLALGPRFNGALWFRAEGAADALRLWFWAERVGVFPGGLLSVWPLAGGALMLRLCAHGNLHVEAYGDAALQALDDMTPHSGWRAVQGHCISGWQSATAASTAIPGRGLVI